MKPTTLIAIFIGIVLCTSCEDILEEVDISNETVTVLAPLNNVVLTTNTVNFNWSGIEEARSYRFQLAQPNFENAQQIVLDSTLAVDTLGNVKTQVQRTLTNGAYQWRVKALNGGFETAYFTNGFTVNGDEDLDVTPPNEPQLVAPVDGTEQDAAVVNFSWTRTDVPGTAERDSIYFFSDESLTTSVGKDIGANKSYSANFATGTYYWFVKAFDTAGNESDDSEAFSFTIN